MNSGYHRHSDEPCVAKNMREYSKFGDVFDNKVGNPKRKLSATHFPDFRVDISSDLDTRSFRESLNFRNPTHLKMTLFNETFEL